MVKNIFIILIISLLFIVPLLLEAALFNPNFESPEFREEAFWRADENKTCPPAAKCYEDSNCGNGKCVGGRICQCNCIEKTLCSTPVLSPLLSTLNGGGGKKCGGLKNACNETSNLCNCDQAFKDAGFKNTLDAIPKVCSLLNKCGSENDEKCHGMPCLPGFCVCPKTKIKRIYKFNMINQLL
ncbi:hypothetical protein Mgra_00008465 [Meloidogyne graminicola]|uniref:EB domain-containing protein n=1 Tax=Meloidogyne graminicola TaxID=189291 RepID=A0A8S9ZFU0_9BILA|nr:hypothetical protein Mgra_00008465 [Meloidogyne graminicola]